MHRSLNEIESILVKAVRGAGLPHGVAVDAARAGRWLCRYGQDGVGAVLTGCRQSSGVTVRNVDRAGPTLLQGGAVAACVAAVDAVQVKAKFNKLIVQGLQSPELLIGLASVAALDRGIAFHLRTNEVAAELDGAWPDNILVPIDDAGDMTLALSAHCHSIAEPTRCARGADVMPSVWQDADSLAARTYVPSTSQSRERGAGAGLSDND